ncbi:MAG: DUF21 domain-containing protein, partial [Oligoflexia bacterium]|nr:DUF21 domain-containing protein [Oligoflexia bacterium]
MVYNKAVDIPDFRLSSVFILLFISAFFSGSETSIFSFGRIGLSELKHENSRWASYFEKLLHKPGRLLATILLGNEFTNVLISTVMASISSDYFGSDKWQTAVIASVLVTTPVLYLFGEVTPKTIAIKSPRQFSLMVVRPLYMLYRLLEPFLNAAAYLVKPLESLLKINDTGKTINEMSFLGIVDESSEKKEIETKEREIIHNIFSFGDKIVNSVMVPREKVFYVR